MSPDAMRLHYSGGNDVRRRLLPEAAEGLLALKVKVLSDLRKGPPIYHRFRGDGQAVQRFLEAARRYARNPRQS